MKEPYVMIGVPSGGGIDAVWTNSIMGLKANGIKTCFLVDMAKPLDKSRYRIVEEAKKQGCSHLFFVDDDTFVPPTSLKQLLSHDKDIVSGQYFQKVPPYLPITLKKIPEDKKDPGDAPYCPHYPTQMAKVDAVGMGCCLIKMEVFDKVPKPYFKWMYWETEEGEPSWLGEDIWFCEQAIEAGFDVWVDPTIICKHIGFTAFGPAHFKQMMINTCKGDNFSFKSGETHDINDIKLE